eukprot:TRINITY_DN2430_c0_g4_i1.p2 TRINITY_DN2430_c0_g4~~TRINITY_DN2430_c0_g4_i1.p2  ORF type:complete len:129 (+),score=16.89 TRINITY_DN2430_c0_g4_i1:149-535(+)
MRFNVDCDVVKCVNLEKLWDVTVRFASLSVKNCKNIRNITIHTNSRLSPQLIKFGNADLLVLARECRYLQRLSLSGCDGLDKVLTGSFAEDESVAMENLTYLSIVVLLDKPLEVRLDNAYLQTLSLVQ